MKAVVTGTWRTMGRVGTLLGRKTAGDSSIKEVPVPVPSSTEILIEVTTVGLNPTDFKHIDLVGPDNAIIGVDYYGTVKAVGSDVENWAEGDRAAGFIHGGLYPDQGAFAQFLVVDADLSFKVPDNISDQDAPTYGGSCITVMQALNVNLGLPWLDETPSDEKKAILVYAASSSAGFFAIQFAVLAGYTVVATCSPRNFELVKSYGATAVYDYRSKSALEEIKKEYPGLSLAFDGFSEAAATDFCCKAMGEGGGKVINLLQGKSTVKGVEVKQILAYTLMGKPFTWFGVLNFPVVPGDREALVRFYAMLPKFAGSGALRPPPTQMVGTGFEAIFEGLELLRQGKVSGKKLVVSLAAGGEKEEEEKKA